MRSDTVTKPTDEMRMEMAHAEVGDDVYEDDFTVKELEHLSAQLLGKESALFVPTCTMGNLICLMTHTTPGEEVILEENSHIYMYEVGGLSRLAGLNARPIKGNKGILNPKDISDAIRSENIHFPKTGLICLENTHNMSGGNVIPLEIMSEIYDLALEKNIPVHLDGARLFNAATYLEVAPKEIAQYVDSVMFCISKGLSAPIGSLIAGKMEFIEKARKHRKLLGGGMRQVGVIASAGIVSLNKMLQRLSKDHQNAQSLAQGLNAMNGVTVDLEATKTNIVRVDFQNDGFNAKQICDKLKKKNILANVTGETKMRFVTHNNIMEADIEIVIEEIRNILHK